MSVDNHLVVSMSHVLALLGANKPHSSVSMIVKSRYLFTLDTVMYLFHEFQGLRLRDKSRLTRKPNWTFYGLS